jgi:hypothetical protein
MGANARTISLVWEGLNFLVVTKSDSRRIDGWATRLSNSNTQTCLISCAENRQQWLTCLAPIHLMLALGGHYISGKQASRMV